MRNDCGNGFDTGPRKENSQKCATQRQRKALRQQLTYQTEAACPQG